jgi:ribosomal protein S27E
MVRARRAGTYGVKSAHVTDATKIVCSNCGDTRFMLSSTIDDPNDITGDTEFAALLLTNAGFPIFGLVALCENCGHEQCHYWHIMDVAASNGGALTMTHLVQATTANLMAGLYCFPLAGTDIGKYFTIATNTAADPTVITPTVAPNNDCDGYWVITNLLPVGLTAAS